MENLFEYIANESNYTQKELASILGTSVATINKWKKYETIPSQKMYRKMLHFCSLIDIDASEYTMEMYVECVLSFVYEDEYSLMGINYDTSKVNIIRNSDAKLFWVELEKITNKKVEL